MLLGSLSALSLDLFGPAALHSVDSVDPLGILVFESGLSRGRFYSNIIL